MTKMVILELPTCRDWRIWLETHHASSAGIWLIYYKDHTGIAAIPYEDSVREALCFGWVDSLIRRIDEDKYARKFTPRKRDSKWSDSNRKRWAELKAAGHLAPAGLTAAPTGHSSMPPKIPALPRYIVDALKTNAKAWGQFQRLAPSHRRQYVAWIHMAVRPETRKKRMAESIRLLAAGETLGLK
jgi:uncharacterized protein YdeI (YjbR/CyaY-like superfamily)